MTKPSGTTALASPLAAVAALLVAGTAGWTHLPSALAAQLDAAECQKLKSEEAELTRIGVRAQFAKGPDWARANLAPDAIERIRRLITLDEQIGFRCPRPPPPKVDEAAATAATAKPKPKPKAEAKAPAAEADQKAKPKPKPKPAPAPDSAEQTTAPKSPAPKAPAKAARAKSEDAFRPPAAKSQE